jgi:tetratricopeptide (TPR) repeat protein
VYASQAQVKDAQECIQHARSLDPYSADTFHAAGCVAEAAGDLGAAEEALQTALALNPAHAPSLLSKGEAAGTPCLLRSCDFSWMHLFRTAAGCCLHSNKGLPAAYGHT